MFKRLFIILAALMILPGVGYGADWSNMGKVSIIPEAADSYVLRARNSDDDSTVFSVDTSGNVSCGEGSIGATEIANITIGEDIPLAALFINGTGPMGADGTTAPGLATTDGIPKIVYASSGETTSIGYSFVLPPNYVSGLSFRMLVSSSAATPASMSIDWQVFVNKDDTAFDAAPFEQTAVSPTTDCSATNEYLAFTIDATAEAGLAAGDTVTVWFYNADLRASGTTEIGSLQKRYTATQ